LIIKIDEGFIFEQSLGFQARGFLLGFFYRHGSLRCSLLGSEPWFGAFARALAVILRLGKRIFRGHFFTFYKEERKVSDETWFIPLYRLLERFRPTDIV
jgi:hypothetical protein